MPDINILINANNKASGPLKDVGKDVDNLGNKATSASQGGLTRLGTALGTSLKVAAAAGGLALAGIGVAVATAGINFDNMKQQATIAFTTMLGDGEKAKTFLDDLQQFAAQTPFEFPDLLRASQRLLAMGFAAEDIKPTLTAVGDAVAGLGGGAAEIDRVTTALGQMQAKGKASAEEMMQLTEAGIPAWQFLADAIGTDVAGAMEQVSKGAIDAETVIGAVVDGMNSKFGGMMEKQSQTFGGLISTLKDTFTQLSGTVMGPLFERMTGWLASIVEWTSKPEFTAGVQKFAEWLDTALAAGEKWWSEMLPKIQGAFTTLMDFVTNELPNWRTRWDDWVLAAWGWIVEAGAVVGTKLAEWGAIVLAWVTDNLPAWTTKLGEWATAAWQWIVDVTPTVVAKLGEWGAAIWGWVTTNAPAWLAKLAEWGKAAWQWIVDVTPTVLTKLGEWTGKLWEWITTNAPTWLTKLGEWATNLWQWIVDVTPTVLTKLGEWATALWGWITTNAPTWLTKLGEWATNLWQWIVDVTPTVITKLGEWAAVLWQWAVDNAPTWGTKLSEWGVKIWDWLTGTDGAIWKVGTKLGEWATALWGWVTDPVNLKKWGDKLAGWATAAWQWIIDAAKLIPGKLAEWWKAITTWYDENLPTFQKKMEEWGKAMIDATAPFGKWMLEEFPAASAASVMAANNLKTAFSNLLGETETSLGLSQTAMTNFMSGLHTVLDSGIAIIITRISNLVASFGTTIKLMDALGDGDWKRMWEAVAEQQARQDKAMLFEAAVFSGNMELAMKLAGQNTVQGFGEGVDAKAQFGVGTVRGFGDEVKKDFSDNLDLKSPSGVFKTFGNMTVQGFINGVDGMLGATGIKMGELFSAVTEKWESIKTAIKNKISDMLTNVTEKWEQIKTAIRDKIEDVLNNARDKWESIKTTIANKISDMLTNITTMWESIKTAISNKIGEIVTNVMDKWESIKTAISDKMGDMLNNVTTKIGEIFTALTSPFAEIYDKFKSFGTGAVQGLIDGLGSMIGAAQAKVTELGNLAAQALGITLESDSPSRRFHRYGEWAGQGFINGMQSKLGAAQQAAASLAQAASTAVQQTVQSVAGKVQASDGTWVSPSFYTSPATGVVPFTGGAVATPALTYAQQSTALYEAMLKNLGIHSPSKKFDWLGEMSAKGFTQGFERGMSNTPANINNSRADNRQFVVNVQSTGDAVRDIRNQVELYALTFGATS